MLSPQIRPAVLRAELVFLLLADPAASLATGRARWLLAAGRWPLRVLAALMRVASLRTNRCVLLLCCAVTLCHHP